MGDTFDVTGWMRIGESGEAHRYRVVLARSFREQFGDGLDNLAGLEALAAADAIIERIEVWPTG